MKKLLVAAMVALALSGCAFNEPPKQQIIYVNKPVPYIPPPPVVPKFESQVDKLTDDDAKDPGKVGQAYKYDVIALRKLVSIYDAILAQYQASSASFDAVNAEIDKLTKQLNPTK